LDVEGKDFAGLTLGEHLERPAAYLAVGGETLVRHTGVHQQLHRLTAIWALDSFAFLHGQRLARNPTPAIGETE
jgi:hypothetical protein